MKIHVLGSTGMLGNYIVKYLTNCDYEVIPYSRSILDVYTFDINWFSKRVKSDDIVINCVGLLKPNIKSHEHAIVVNKNFPLILDLLSERIGNKLINFSSDCVYSGSKGTYIETDKCDALDYYGITKRHEYLNSTVMRLSFIGEELYNKIGFLEFALKNKGTEVLGYSNCLWNGLTGLEIAKIIDKMIRNEGISFWRGVRHIFSNKVVSKLELLELINKIYSLDLKVVDHRATNISGTSISNVLDRSLSTIYTPISIPDMECMLTEQKNYIYEY
jgi:dTDP-4-dehydrorhamnose reductase